MRWKTPARWLGTFSIRIVVFLVALEIALRVAAWLVVPAGPEFSASWLTGRTRILSIGDSNTYGMWLDPAESYPVQLEALWNETVDHPKLEVMNLGFPGTNSSRVVRDLARLVDTFEPDLVIVMVGVNDFWTQPFETGDAQPRVSSRSFLERHSLIFKLYYLIRRYVDSRELELEMGETLDLGEIPDRGDHVARFGDEVFEMGFVRRDGVPDTDREGLTRNLRTIARQTRDLGIPLYFMTYPARWNFYVLANPIIRSVALETETPLIDLTRPFISLCQQKECPSYFFTDQHPTAEGYRVVAETIVEKLSNEVFR